MTKNLSLEDMIISPSFTIESAMQFLDKSPHKIVFVKNEYGDLVGSVTDGDIRRAILAGIQLDAKIPQAMNRNPLTCDYKTSKEDIRAILKNNSIDHIPIIKNKKIIRIETLLSLEIYDLVDNPVFIMAGGFGTRLRPLTDSCPKPMLPVGGKPMLEQLIGNLKIQGFRNFFISTYYLSELIEEYFSDGSRWDVSIRYVREKTPLGTAGALSLLPEDMPQLPLLMLNCDLLTDIDYTTMLTFHKQGKYDATVCLREIEHQVSFGVVETTDCLVNGIIEKPTYRYDINAGIYLLSTNFIKECPTEKYIDMPSYIEKRISLGKKIGAMRHTGYWLDIGSKSDYQKAQNDFKKLKI